MGVQLQESTFDVNFKDLENDPVFLRKRKATFICFFMRMFLLGAEYAVILPSVWLYLQRFDVQPWFLGFVVAIYPTGAVLSSFFTGIMYHKTKQTKEMVLFLNAFEIVGNILYALPVSKWLIVSGRFIAGLGDGFFACAASEIVHTYTLADRTGILALLELGRVLGFTLAPGLNFLLVDIDFSIGDWVIDNGTVPGVIMAILWILSQILCFFCISNLALMIEDHTIVSERTPLARNNNQENVKNYQATNVKMCNLNELAENNNKVGDFNTEAGKVEAFKKHQGMLHHIFELLTSVEVLAIFYADLILRVIQTEFEVFVPLLTQDRYGWGEEETSCVYIVGGVWLMISYLLIFKFSTQLKIKDQHYIVASLVLTTFALSVLLTEQFVPKQYRVAMFVTFATFEFSATPLNLVACKSLLTKITPRESQGVTQAAYMSIIQASFILGPIITGAAFSQRLQFTIAMIGFCVIAFIVIVSLLKRIKNKIVTIQGCERLVGLGYLKKTLIIFASFNSLF